MTTDQLHIRNMTRAELNVLVDWAANEGWNTGLHDAEVFWATNPDAFIAAEFNGKMIGGGSIVNYGRFCGFMGFFIIHPQFRGRGFGAQLWLARRERLIKRLQAPARIEMDGVFHMQSFYAKGGFKFLRRDLRFQGVATETMGNAVNPQAACAGRSVVDLLAVAFDEVNQYDQSIFVAPRAEFLRRWISQPACHALGVVENRKLVGYSVARACRVGYKIGPLFANDPAIANMLFESLLGRLPQPQVQIDVPECNAPGLEMVKRCGLKEVFGCARMAFGAPLPRPQHNIFGVTTFELG